MIHPSSLVSCKSHPEPIYELLELEVDRALVATIVEESTETVNYALGLPTASRGRLSVRTPLDKEFIKFVEQVLVSAEVSITDILVTLVYLRRARAHLAIDTEDWAFHRVFLGALVLAHKYSNDSTLKNISWSNATNAFGIRDIGRMEREFLDVLDYDLSVSEADLLDLHETLVPDSRSSRPTSQLHPFFHTSVLESERPQGGVPMFRTHRVTDDASDEQDWEDSLGSSGSFYGDYLQTFAADDELDGSEPETNFETRSPVLSSPEARSSSESSSEPSTAATSAFSHPRNVGLKPEPNGDGVQLSTISKALWLAGHQLISSLPAALSQVAVSS